MTAFQYLGRGKLGIWIFLFSVFVKLTQMLRFKCHRHCELGRGRETTAASFDKISDAERRDTDVARPELQELEEHQ